MLASAVQARPVLLSMAANAKEYSAS
jgi:hypothetical protein